MIQKCITAQRDLLKTQAAAEFIKNAMEYRSELRLECKGRCVNPKSLLGVMCLEISSGAVLNLTADGPDEGEAIKKLAAFFNEPTHEKP